MRSSFVEARAGVESFAFVDEEGRLHGYHRWRPTPSASVLKPMLMVAYLNLASVRDRALDDRDRSSPRSDDQAVGQYDRRGRSQHRRQLGPLPRRTARPHAALSRASSGLGPERDHGRRPGALLLPDRVVRARAPPRVRATTALAHRLLAAVGDPSRGAGGWKVFFKGGWGSGTGRVTHQVALLEQDDRRLAIAVLTEFNPSHDYGTRTVRGVARAAPAGAAARPYPFRVGRAFPFPGRQPAPCGPTFRLAPFPRLLHMRHEPPNPASVARYANSGQASHSLAAAKGMKALRSERR